MWKCEEGLPFPELLKDSYTAFENIRKRYKICSENWGPVQVDPNLKIHMAANIKTDSEKTPAQASESDGQN